MNETKFTYTFDLEELENDAEEYDNEAEMLAVLIVKEIIFVTNNHLWVFCSDMFAWAMSDGEDITLEEIPDLYHEWYKDQAFGALKWVAKKRNLQPQEPVIEWIKKEGLWDDEWEALDFGDYNRYMVQRREERKNSEQSKAS